MKSLLFTLMFIFNISILFAQNHVPEVTNVTFSQRHDGSFMVDIYYTGATNESGFTALPGGYREGDYGGYYLMGGLGYWWSATASSSSTASCITIIQTSAATTAMSRVAIACG